MLALIDVLCEPVANAREEGMLFKPFDHDDTTNANNYSHEIVLNRM